jgi:hypothetical protein
MPKSAKTEKLWTMLYDLLMAMADPKTGVVLANSKELEAMLGRKYNTTQICNGLLHLVKTGEINTHRDRGTMGNEYVVPELTKGNTVTTKIHDTVTMEDFGKPYEKFVIPETQEPSTYEKKYAPIVLPETEKSKEEKSRTPVECVMDSWDYANAAEYARKTLRDTDHIVGDVLSAFIQMRDALDRMIREVDKHA